MSHTGEHVHIRGDERGTPAAHGPGARRSAARTVAVVVGVPSAPPALSPRARRRRSVAAAVWPTRARAHPPAPPPAPVPHPHRPPLTAFCRDTLACTTRMDCSIASRRSTRAAPRRLAPAPRGARQGQRLAGAVRRACADRAWPGTIRTRMTWLSSRARTRYRWSE